MLAHALVVSSRLERVEPAGRAEGFIWRKAGPARRVALLIDRWLFTSMAEDLNPR